MRNPGRRSILRSVLALFLTSAALAHFAFALYQEGNPESNRNSEEGDQSQSSYAQLPRSATDRREQPTQQLTKQTPIRPPHPVDIELHFSRAGRPTLNRVPQFIRKSGDRFFGYDQRGNRVYFTIDPALQERAELVLQRSRADYASIVSVMPETGKILSVASFSTREPGRGLASQSRFPAASLIKVITAAAAVETAGMDGADKVAFRGGNYDLNRHNYLPSAKGDRRQMSLAEAMAKSVNAVFARVALSKFETSTLKRYAEMFGFNDQVVDEFPLEQSQFSEPFDDYSYARTAAGFGPVYVSPVHAALIAAASANKGTMMRPYLIENIVNPAGAEVYRARPSVLKQTVLPTTAESLMKMMEGTVQDGTARRAFAGANLVPISGKTGTLSGPDPKGLYTWFIGAAPSYHPEIAVAAMAIDSGGVSARGSALARHMFDFYFRRRFGMSIPDVQFSPTRQKAVQRKGSGVKKARKKQVVKHAVRKAAPKKAAAKKITKKSAPRKSVKKKASPKKAAPK